MRNDLDPTFGISIGKKTVPWHFAAHWQWQKIIPGLDVDDAVEILLRWRPQDTLRDDYELGFLSRCIRYTAVNKEMEKNFSVQCIAFLIDSLHSKLTDGRSGTWCSTKCDVIDWYSQLGLKLISQTCDILRIFHIREDSIWSALIF